MSQKKTIKIRKAKKFPIFWIAGLTLIVVWALLGLYFLSHEETASVFISSESPKQGDTIFIRVKTEADEITGNFGQERLVFYRKGNLKEWISFLGIDADQEPGDYEIRVDTSKAEHIKKEIKIGLADFSTSPTVSAPKNNKNGISNKKSVDNIRNNDNPALQKILSNLTPAPYFINSFSFPLSKVEESGFPFGKFIGFSENKLQHLGVDLRAPEKTDVFSVNDGRVVATLDLSNYGKTVIIDHGLDIFSMYLHLEEFKVLEGQMVSKGQCIGLSGDTGYATAPHLHFSMRVGGSRVDPLVFINTTKKMNDNFFLADLMEAVLNIFP